MTDLHIDDFYRDVAKIFLRLYAAFPRKMILYVDDISGPDEPDEFGLHSPRYQSCHSAMVWLAEQGYLRFAETVREEALDQVVLTQRSFLLLSSRSALDTAEIDAAAGATPSVIENSLSNVVQLRAALKTGSSIAIKRQVSFLLSQPPISGQ